jgi:Xaa-Pro aminopeptidase
MDRLIKVQEYCENIIKQGLNIKQLNTEASEYYKKFNPSGMSFVTGHSIGIECEEQHLFGPLQILDRPFEKNMVFEIEIWENFNKTLIGVEDCYVITNDGCRRITKLNKHIFSK